MNTETGEIRMIAPGEKLGPKWVELTDAQHRIANQVTAMDAKVLIPNAESMGGRTFSRAERRKQNGGRSDFMIRFNDRR